MTTLAVGVPLKNPYETEFADNGALHVTVIVVPTGVVAVTVGEIVIVGDFTPRLVKTAWARDVAAVDVPPVAEATFAAS